MHFGTPYETATTPASTTVRLKAKARLDAAHVRTSLMFAYESSIYLKSP